MFNAEKFWDKRADWYKQHSHGSLAGVNQKIAARISDHLTTTDRVLDFACGPAMLSLALAPQVKELIGTDISARMVELARDIVAEAGATNVKFHHTSLLSDTLQNGSYDKLLAVRILHILDQDLPAHLQRIHQLLTDDGLFIAVTPTRAGLSTRFALRFLLMRFFSLFGLAPKFKLHTIAELKAMFTDNHFTIVESELLSDPGGMLGMYLIVGKKSGH